MAVQLLSVRVFRWAHATFRRGLRLSWVACGPGGGWRGPERRFWGRGCHRHRLRGPGACGQGGRTVPHPIPTLESIIRKAHVFRPTFLWRKTLQIGRVFPTTLKCPGRQNRKGRSWEVNAGHKVT